MANENVKNKIEQADDTGDNPINLDGTIKSLGKDVTEDMVYEATIEATLAELNTGKRLIDGVSGRYLRIVDIEALCDGTFTTATSVDVVGSSGVPIMTYAIAALVNQRLCKHLSVLSPLIVKGVGLGFNLAAGESVDVGVTGAAIAGGSRILFLIKYKIS